MFEILVRCVDVGSTCPVCEAVPDPMGDHHITCKGNGGLIRWHDSLRNVIFVAAQSAALAPRKEVPTLIADSSSCPADVSLPCWKHGRPAAIDVTVISTVQQLTVGRVAVLQGHALTVGGDRKHNTHDNACHEAVITFIKLVAEYSLKGGAKKELTPSESLENTRPFVSVSHLPMPSHISSNVC